MPKRLWLAGLSSILAAGCSSGTAPSGAPHLVFSVQPSATQAATTIMPAVQVSAENAQGQLDSAFAGSITVRIGTNAGGGTLAGTAAVAAVGGVATFGTLSIDKSGAGYTLAASATGLPGATSAAFNVTLPPCTSTSGGQVSQALAAFSAIDPTQSSGCALFQANATGGTVSYLVVPQITNGVPDDSSAFLLGGGPFAAPPVMTAVAGVAAPLLAQHQFDLTLRRAERELALEAGPRASPRAAPLLPAAPVPGTSRTFKVCGDATCTSHPIVTATAKKVGLHVALYVDNAATTAGDTLGTADFDTLAAVFDTLLYRTDTAAFGRESDIDGNGVVIVLMTGRVNSLVTSSQCTSTGFIAGYFYGGDLITGFSGGNNGEIFYSIVPDPSGTLSCTHSASQVKHLVPGTFIHEFQHMISFNQHFLRHGTAPEDLWLNEGMSHYAEELGGRSFLPDTTQYCYFVFGDLHNAGQYFGAPQNVFLVDTAGLGGLSNRGAYWLLVRFVVDQFALDTSAASANALTRSLENTALTGAANIAAATGNPFGTVVEHWALANYVSDLPGFTAPPALRYVKWHFRTDYPTLHQACLARGVTGSVPSSYTLVPLASGDASAWNLTGTMRGGSGSYYVAQQAAGAQGVSLLFSTSNKTGLPSSRAPRLNVIRIQ